MARRWAVHGLHPKGDVEANARHLLGVRMAEFYALAPAVRAGGPPERLHDLRIAAKRLRYTLELFASTFGEAGERQIERLKTVQEQLGELRDHDARIALIADELGRVEAETAARLEAALAGAAEPDIGAIAQATAAAADPRRGLIALLGRERERRQACWIAFRTSWEQFDRAAMRADLARLSALPLDHDEARGQDESEPGSATTGAAA
ncbi:MAG TPA: CHAD domain-containing protein [Thermomicrobiales bacterium]|nr:CHAD domain-containing protein [Thermomicrobiales bacterium]